MRSRVYSWYTVFSEMQFISGIGNQPELSSEIGTTWAELSSEIGTTWAELSWADFFMGRVVLGRLFFGPSCPEPIFSYHRFGWVNIIRRITLMYVRDE